MPNDCLVNLSIPLCVPPVATTGGSNPNTGEIGQLDLAGTFADWLKSSIAMRQSLENIGIKLKSK